MRWAPAAERLQSSAIATRRLRRYLSSRVRTERRLRARVWLEFGRRLRAMGRARAAVRALRRSLELHEACWRCWALLADAEASLGRLGSAIVAYHRLLGLRPDMAWGWYNLALLYERLGYARRAAEACARSLRVARNDPGFRAIIGVPEDRAGAAGANSPRGTYLPN